MKDMAAAEVAIVVNGNVLSVPVRWTVADLVAGMISEQGAVAVELNHRILKRQDWHLHCLGESDQLEIVHFVGGG